MRHTLFIILLFCLASTGLGVAAWHGQKGAIIALCVFNVILASLLRVTQSLLDSVLGRLKEATKGWRHDLAYAEKITRDYTQVLVLLYEHDPSAAEVFQDRLSKAVTARHPEILEASAAKRAEMN
jgi:Na+/phosphate symporter